MTTSVLSDPLTHYRRILKSWDEPRSEVVYRWLQNTYAIDGKIREAAEAGRKFACLHLGVDVPELLYYREASSTEKAYAPTGWLFTGARRNGHADRFTHTIGVRVEGNCRPKHAAEVAAHEVCHLTQPKFKEGRDVEAEEADALAYGRWAANVLFADGKLANVRTYKGFPYDFVTLRGVANGGDVLIAQDGGERDVFRNFGSSDIPRWVRNDAVCPAAVRI